MNIDTLQATARAMVAPGKGILAMDESAPTCNKRFEALGIPATIEMRREYRTMLVSSPGLGEYIGGAILFDETLRDRLRGIRLDTPAERGGVTPMLVKEKIGRASCRERV